MRQPVARVAKTSWLRKEVYPLIGIMGFAGAITAYQVYHKLSGKEIALNKIKNPDPFLKVPRDFSPHYVKVKAADTYKF
ncbi:hypothetical protein AYI69_g9439 [Smittium culicis]|uniref:Uncharacterized protein n=1 Tax=Smittium culicis TaxID=133412 RepID=A0A1R1XCM0_9FUNG|nr:hypothetical protein AYI69_g10010 [Smittium culicis]OMJ12346.1 hypothetical protein AYI69_g9439 [Smittium culicis]